MTIFLLVWTSCMLALTVGLLTWRVHKLASRVLQLERLECERLQRENVALMNERTRLRAMADLDRSLDGYQ